ncbi:hypothetical protein SMC26_23995 [Actinomadura fulvescens]|uniref:hypothetical protein n=1 Tax=Actinomadura fulvescens TaxID=46160 RepID=UPI0031E366D0
MNRREQAAAIQSSGELVVVGAHGGAGTSTLAALLAPSWDLGSITVLDLRHPQVLPATRPLVLVCRNTAAGTRAATLAVTALGDRGQPVAALVIVSDGWPEPKGAAARLTMLHGRVGAMVRIPFIASLRAVDDPTSVRLPTRAQTALATVRGLTTTR